ncbi:MAG TPA: hypothetical protein VED18_00830 [Candidatus Sulfotelmatobacter sp.]|nr:hypothetical protein [Candidatus Sulfotelmatobacter sp.]
MPVPDTPDAYAQATGDVAVLVLLDRRFPEHRLLVPSTLSLLDHCGIPFRLLDLASTPLTREALAQASAVVLAQEHLGAAMEAEAWHAILEAVRGGMGLVNFDYDLEGNAAGAGEALGLMPTGRGGAWLTDSAEKIEIAGNGHYITWAQDGVARKRLKMPVPVRLARSTAPTAVLATTTDGTPVALAAPVGRGRAVQWLASPKLWLRQYFGHARGLDDLFWKSIVWAARKPFVMKAMPPFVRMRFDDCHGHWRNGADFRFIEVLNEFGHVPNASICVRAITEDGARKVKELHDTRRCEFSPHTLAPGVSIFWGDQNGPYDEATLRRNLEEVVAAFQRWGVRYSPILSDHDHSWGPAVVPFLRARGIRYKMNITEPDGHWNDVHRDWRPAPYGSMDYALDYLPGGRDFFVVFNHYPTFEYARAYLDADHFLYNRAGGYGEVKWDFLNGLTRGPARAENDLEAAARRLADHTRLGLDSLFFGGSITHSHFTKELTEDEWRRLMRRADELMPRHERIPVGYDHVAEYARSKVDTHIADAARERRGETVRVVLRGEATVPLKLYVFRDVGDGAEHRYEEVPPFRGGQEVRFTAPAGSR